MNLGYVGLGQMGGALARRLMLSHKLRVYDRNPQMLEAFAREGAVPAQNAEALARECDVVLTCLPTSADVRDALFGEGGLAAGLAEGTLVIDQTTGDPNVTRALAADLAARGIDLIDAPVSGGPKGAKAGTIAIMVGGSEALYEKARRFLEAVSPNVFHCGGVGAGHVMKLVNNVTSACNRVATFEAVAMGVKNGLDAAKIVEVLDKGSGHSSATSNILPRMLRGDDATFSLELLFKDVRLACQLGIDSGATMLAANLTREYLQTAIQMLGAKVGSDEIMRVTERNAGVKVVG